MSKSLYKKVSIASLIMMSSVFLSRVIGIFREAVIAHMGGATGEVDAYLIAFLIPDILNHIVASGFLSITFIPIFSHYLATNEEEKGWEAFSIILTCFGILLLLLIIIAFIFTPEFIAIVAPGINEPALTNYFACPVFLFCRWAVHGHSVCQGKVFSACSCTPFV
jgi:putative peptidoglycan lipid II flippase